MLLQAVCLAARDEGENIILFNQEFSTIFSDRDPSIIYVYIVSVYKSVHVNMSVRRPYLEVITDFFQSECSFESNYSVDFYATIRSFFWIHQ